MFTKKPSGIKEIVVQKLFQIRYLKSRTLKFSDTFKNIFIESAFVFIE